MATVETVRGPVEVDALGATLMHEHVFVMQPEALANYGAVWGPSYWDEDSGVADAVAKLQRLRDSGITTLVDATAPGIGRDIARLRRVNAEVDLNIVVASGLYAFLEMPNFLRYRSDDVITEIFVREIREGINDTGVKAAFLKCAIEEYGLVGDVPRILRTVAAASVETGVPVMVHTNAEFKTGLLALEALTGAGVDPSRIIIAHAGDSNDMDYLHELAQSGAWLGMDRFGIDHFNLTADRVRTLSAMLDAGYIDQLHISHDAGTFHDFMVGNPFFTDEHPDYLFISQTVLPLLAEAGVGEETVQRMFVDTPRRFFASYAAA
jgi:phosphotriesterase-related protein